jgi:hypothetical protein
VTPQDVVLAVDEICLSCVEPGKVRARTRGRVVCMEKHIGKSADWRVENGARGRTRYAVVPAVKDWKTSVPRRVPSARTWYGVGDRSLRLRPGEAMVRVSYVWVESMD